MNGLGKSMMLNRTKISRWYWVGCWILLQLVVSTSYFVRQASAESLQSDSFIIQFGNFNITSGEKSGETYTVTDTVGQSFAGPYGEYGVSNYFIGSGFQYIYQIKPFQFVISNTNINLGLLTAQAHNTASHTLLVNAPNAGGYTVYAYEAHPLQTIDGSYAIPDTTCDNNDCDETVAKLWQDTEVGGFGFNIQGNDVASDFLSADHFRQFANKAATSPVEPMEAVMSTTSAAFNRQASVTYKAGLSGSEAAGRYQTSVVYIAVPGY